MKKALKAILIFLLKLALVSALVLGILCAIILTAVWFLLPEWFTYNMADDLERAGKIEEAIAVYKQEAEKGNSYAAAQACRLYVSNKNFIGAEMWLKKVAEKGDGYAALMLSAMYLADKDIDGNPNPLKNIAEAEKWLSSIGRDSIANSIAHSFARYGLGMLYLTGTPTFYYDILDKLKMYGIDNLCFVSTCVEKDINKAFGYFAVAYGDHYSSAAYELGMLFYNGTGVKKDIAMAKEMFTKSIHWAYSLAPEMIGKNKIKEAEEMLRKIEESEQNATPAKDTENQ